MFKQLKSAKTKTNVVPICSFLIYDKCVSYLFKVGDNSVQKSLTTLWAIFRKFLLYCSCVLTSKLE